MLSDGIWVLVIVLFRSRWKKVHFKEMIRIFGGSRKQPWGAPLVRKSADLQQIEAKTMIPESASFTPAADSFPLIWKYPAGTLSRQNLEPKPCCKRDVSSAKIAAGDNVAGDTPSACLPAAAALNNSCGRRRRRRRNIASGSHRHADPCRRRGKHCTCTHANTSMHFMEIAALPLEWNCFFGRKWKPSETSCRHYFSNKK